MPRRPSPLFLTTTVLASLVTLPQPTWALGVELLVAAAASASLLSVPDHAARRGTSEHARPVLVVALVAYGHAHENRWGT
ncbi:hypothetical protein ACWDMR_19745 [Streptomyces althioticus]|uniref:Secreted protein n=1 Tax=Streptomyces griseorubens TaxID=66897 RepID=A0ABR4T1V2_9ACTN|nr:MULTISPECIES: hypothetical protein [Actinomycetes]KEG40946.1 hypothetical protein DJ64_06480 [Streptomyces griseorubens]MCC9687364.1 hypothetical protein [Streptomyces sp. MNU103]GGQ37954.1 hypothetical protein GCM10010250_04900 [Streptomyces althioticus]GGT62058.1 hypothetical protein GCM10010243_46310 [Streptomyces matensis]